MPSSHTSRNEQLTTTERNKRALKEKYLTDTNFALRPNKIRFSAHKTILALSSPVFEAMLYGDMKETGEVIIPDLDPEGFKLLLDYIYTDEMDINSPKDAFSAWVAGDKYCVPYVKKLCEKYLLNLNMTDKNVWTCLEKAILLSSEQLESKCMTYLIHNINTSIKDSSFLTVPREIIIRLLKEDTLSIREYDLFQGVMEWAQGQKQEAEPLLGFIRFGCMTLSELVKCVHNYNTVISDADALSLIKFKTNSVMYSPPAWCCRNLKARKNTVRRARTFSTDTICHSFLQSMGLAYVTTIVILRTIFRM